MTLCSDLAGGYFNLCAAFDNTIRTIYLFGFRLIYAINPYVKYPG